MCAVVVLVGAGWVEGESCEWSVLCVAFECGWIGGLSVLPVPLVGGVCARILTQCLRELLLYLCNWHIPKVMITYISFVVVLKTCQAE